MPSISQQDVYASQYPKELSQNLLSRREPRSTKTSRTNKIRSTSKPLATRRCWESRRTTFAIRNSRMVGWKHARNQAFVLTVCFHSCLIYRMPPCLHWLTRRLLPHFWCWKKKLIFVHCLSNAKSFSQAFSNQNRFCWCPFWDFVVGKLSDCPLFWALYE